MSGCEATPEIKRILRAMAKNRVAAGHTDAAEIVDAIHDEIQDHTPLWKSEIADIISGYGEVRKPTKDELTQRMNALRAELRDDARRADVAMGKVDPAAEKNAARTASLKKQIDDLNARIAAGGKEPGETPLPRTPEVMALERQRDALRTKLNALTSSAKDAAERASLQRQLDGVNEKLAGKAPPQKAPEQRADTKEAAELKKQLAAARAKLADKRLEEGKRKSLEDRIADLLQRLAGKDKPAKDAPAPDSAKVADLKRIRDQLQDELTELEKKPPKSKDEIRQAQIKKQIEAIEQRIRTGDFSKKPRTPAAYSPETMELEAALAKARKAADREIRRLEAANRTPAQKLWDGFLALRRAVILSSVHTLGKLTSAATQRMISTPTEEAIGSVLRLIPGLRQIDAMAPREGGGFSPTAEKAALANTFSKDTGRQMLDTFKNGLGKLDSLFGKDEHPVRGLLDLIGQAHGALKTPAKINEFHRAIEKRAGHLRRQLAAEGKTPAEIDAQLQSPTTMAMLAAKAYEDGQRAILMSDNPMVTGFRMVLAHAKNHGAAGKTAAGVLEYLLPIVKIPTNFVAETSSYAAGAPKALGAYIAAGGFKKLTPDHADYIMRNLKKQTVGAALLAMGYYATDFIQASGYYQPGDNKKKGRPEPGTARINIDGEWHEIPKWALHSPPMEILQMGATIRRVSEAEHRHRGSPTTHGSLGEGAYAAGTGLVGEVPFFDTFRRVEHGMENYSTAGVFLGNEARGALIPPDVQNIAKGMDDNTQRKPTSFTEAVEMGVPGLRDNVPTKHR